MKHLWKAAVLVVALLILAGCAAFFNSPPVANFTVNPTTGSAPLTVYVNATNSYDTDGHITSWRWSFGDGGSGYGETTSHRYVAPGTYIIRLTVTDNRGDVDTCYYSVVVTEPYPYSFTDPNKPYYPKTRTGARRFVSDARSLWSPESNLYLKNPSDSYSNMRGDCDDFALMLAYYLQDGWWGYDTFVVILDPSPGGRYSEPHACAYVCSENVNLDPYPPAFCQYYPALTYLDRLYQPVDFTECPFWNYNDYYIRWERVPNLQTGLYSWKQVLEWSDLYLIDLLVHPLDSNTDGGKI